MPNFTTQKDAFKFFKVKKGTWSRGPWSSLNDDGTLLILTIWTDQKEYLGQGKYLTNNYHLCNELWKDDNNNKKRIEHIKYCQKNLKSKFRVVFVTPKEKDVFDGPRTALNWNAYDKAWFEVTDFDQLTGEFKSISILE